jgi:hypothetical protein
MGEILAIKVRPPRLERCGMRFFLARRDRDTGDVRLVSEQTYDSRPAALDALGTAVAADVSMASQDLFVVDLEQATPVVMYAAPGTAAQSADEQIAEEPIADVWEAPQAPVDAMAEISALEDSALEGFPPVWAPEEDGVTGASLEDVAVSLDDAEAVSAETATAEMTPEARAAADELEAAIAEPAPPGRGLLDDEPQGDASSGSVEAEPETIAVADATEPESEAEPLVEVPADDDDSLDLAEALRRAASQMEAEGIVPAPQVEDLVARRPVEETAEPAGLLEEVEVVDPVTDAGVEAAPAAWPWETGESSGLLVEDADLPVETLALGDAPSTDTAPAEEREPMEAPSAAAFTPVGIDEPGLEDITLLTPADGAGWLEQRAEVVDEYADGIGDDKTPGVSAEDNSLVELQVILGEYGTVPSEAAESSGVGDEGAAVEGLSAEAVIEALAAETGEAPVEPPEAPKVYEPGGLDISTYTCDDCVYVETCPKAKQDGPATCGSFQWKSV